MQFWFEIGCMISEKIRPRLVKNCIKRSPIELIASIANIEIEML